jgi:epoxyqueuosine reductase
VRSARPSPVVDQDYLDQLRRLTEPYGVSHTGVCDAEVLHRARAELHRRAAAGLNDSMQFTYKNPERSTDPTQAVREARTVFVAAMPYATDDPPRPPGVQARIAKYARADFYAPLRRALREVSAVLRADGFRSTAFADDNSIVDREVAYRAGIGWFGKNANLLLPGAGSWFVLGCVVTTAPLPLSGGPIDDGCGACRRCFDACPTDAIIAPGVIDAAKCLAWVVQKPGIVPRAMREQVGDRMYGCDECQLSCPPTIRFGARFTAPRFDHPPQAWVDALAVLNGSDDDVMATWGEWYLADRDPRWVRRNALIVVGNIGDPGDPAVSSVVARYLVDPDPMLRVHAVWAAQRLHLHHMLPTTDPDADVRAELAQS